MYILYVFWALQTVRSYEFNNNTCFTYKSILSFEPTRYRRRYDLICDKIKDTWFMFVYVYAVMDCSLDDLIIIYTSKNTVCL